MNDHRDEAPDDINCLTRQANINVLFRQAATCFQQGRLEDAEMLVQNLLNKHPGHADANHLLGLIIGKHGEYTKAVQLITRAIRIDPHQPAYHFNQGLALHKDKRPEEALAAWERAIQLNPGYVEAYYYRGLVLSELGLTEEALADFDQVIEFRPEYAKAHNNRGYILMEMGHLEEALVTFERAIQLKPQYANAYYNRGIVLRDLNCPNEAIATFKQAIQLKKDFASAHNDLGLVLLSLDRPEEALESCEKAIDLKPKYAEAHVNHAIILSKLGRLVEALSACEQAILFMPEFAKAHYNIGLVLIELGHPDKAEVSIHQALQLKPDYLIAHSGLLYLLAARASMSPEAMLAEQRHWDRVHGEAGRRHPMPARGREDITDRRLRVGYVSPDFCGHVVSYFFEPLLAAHDRSRFEVFCYAARQESLSDDTTGRLRTMAEHWRFVAGDSDAELARRIHEDGIDILIDLAGHTKGSRLRAFTYRPAPVQATYLGFFAATGLEAMDYWITDEVLHPEDAPEQTVEQIYRLPRCWVCYRPPAEAPDVAPCPNADEPVVLGAFSHLSKLTPAVYATWSRLLQALPGSRLLLMDKSMADPKTRQLLLERFAQHGIPAERLMLRGRVPLARYFAAYAEVDIVLDPFPRTGGTTTAEALWMGVPVVTLAGQRYAERISASTLTAVGLGELITHSQEEYRNTVLSLAQDPGRRADLRAGLRKQMAQSPLCDGKGLARAMESAYTSMWQQFLSRL